MTRTNLIIALIVIATVGFVVWTRLSDPGQQLVSVRVPALAGPALAGETLFNDKCATCHGSNAAGSNQGPPLVHKIYEPNHHGDGSFLNAVQNGVRAHHWNFGNMPPQTGVSSDEVVRIVAYVRTLQRANGIN